VGGEKLTIPFASKGEGEKPNGSSLEIENKAKEVGGLLLARGQKRCFITKNKIFFSYHGNRKLERRTGGKVHEGPFARGGL